MLVNKTAVTTFLYSVLAMQLYIGRQYCFLNVLYATNACSPSLSLPYFLSLQHDLLFLTSAIWFFYCPIYLELVIIIGHLIPIHMTADDHLVTALFFLYIFFKNLKNFVDRTFHLTTYSLSFVFQTSVSFSRILLYFLTHVFCNKVSLFHNYIYRQYLLL